LKSPSREVLAELARKTSNNEPGFERDHHPNLVQAAQVTPPPLPAGTKMDGPAPAGTDPLLVTDPMPVATMKVPEDPPLVLSLRAFLDKRPSEAIVRLKDYDPANQEVLLCLLPLATLLTETSLAKADAQNLAAVVDQLDGLQTVLRPRADLTVHKMCFCRRIHSYGAYDPLPDDYQFFAGDTVQVYVELRNVASLRRERRSGGVSYVTRLTSSAVIRDQDGNQVWPANSAQRIVFERLRPEEESRSLRHDYFEKYQLDIPNLPPGRYALWIRVEDEGTRPVRVVQRSLDFRVTNQRAGGS
jgi:hypothetical protein